MLERSRAVSDMVTDNPLVFAAQDESTLANVERRAPARRAFLDALSLSAGVVARLLVEDPDALARVARAIADEELREPEARQRLIEELLPTRPSSD